VLATGAGAGARQSLGTVVVGGLALATVLIVTVPATYFMIGHLADRHGGLPTGNTDRTRAADLSEGD
jgi:Cu/Ag efflux pump CusA